MKYQFEQRRGSVTVNRRLVGGFDGPTQVEDIIITRKDGHQFRTFGAFGSWTCYGDSPEALGGCKGLVITDYFQLRAWAKRHSLPSMDWIDDQMNAIDRLNSEWGCPSQYI